MALIVQKFGGSSVADRERIFHVARLIAQAHGDGDRVVAVVSAQGDTTDDLLKKAGDITARPDGRELDVLLSAGEQISTALLCMALGELGVRAVSLTGWQAGFHTDRVHTRARIRRLDVARIQSELDKNRVVVVAGFQGVDRCGDITTLGRGGSDTSAVALACALGAQRCLIYTDVDGVYTADPRKVPAARRLRRISYAEMLELAAVGAQVLHSRSVVLACCRGMPLAVLSSMEPGKGTLVTEVGGMEGMQIKGVAAQTDTGLLEIRLTQPQAAQTVLAALTAKRFAVRQTLQCEKTLWLVLEDAAAQEALVLLQQAELPEVQSAALKPQLACVSVVGSGIGADTEVLPRMLAAVNGCGQAPVLVTGGELRVSVFVARTAAQEVLRAVHAAFFETA